MTREPDCVDRWPGCASGEYDPRCCRFPKSCSVREVPDVWAQAEDAVRVLDAVIASRAAAEAYNDRPDASLKAAADAAWWHSQHQIEMYRARYGATR